MVELHALVRMEMNDQPLGIIKTMPKKWLEELETRRGGFERWEKLYLQMNKVPHLWYFTLSNKPKHDVLFFYLLIDGAIRYRSNIIGYEYNTTKALYTGGGMFSKVWVLVARPVIKLENPIKKQGFQGFRYCFEEYE